MKYGPWFAAAAVLVAAVFIYYLYLFTPGYVEGDRLVYPIEALDDGVTAISLGKYGLTASWGQGHVYVVHVGGDEGYRALSSTSPLGGCTLAYRERQQVFVDPCYGGISLDWGRQYLMFSLTGEPVEPPADAEDIGGMYIHVTEQRGDELVITRELTPWEPSS